MLTNIASERKRMGITQQQLADSIHVSRSTVARWEQGIVLPYGSELVKMHQLFKCSTDYLLGLTEERVGSAA